MQIRSTFGDYYDKHQVYNSPYTYIRSCVSSYNNSVLPKAVKYGQRFQIGFCGEIFNGLFIPKNDGDKFWMQKHPDMFIYSLEEYEEFKKISTEDRRDLSFLFTRTIDDSDFVKYNAPVYIRFDGITYAHSMSGIGNSAITLREFEFERIKPSHIAYMEIESYISGVLMRQHKTIPQMDNATKVAIHGFDKHSFRNKR